MDAITKLNLSERRVRVIGVTDGFVQFEFTVCDPLLTVELVMPLPAFDAFCADQGAIVTIRDDVQGSFQTLKAASSVPIHPKIITF